jgi:hypothetical protein
MFPDMPRNDTDNHIRKELLVPLERQPRYWLATPVFVLKKDGPK